MTEAIQADNIVLARGQRAGAKDDPRLDWWREAKFFTGPEMGSLSSRILTASAPV